MQGYVLDKEGQRVADVEVEINADHKHATGIILTNNILPRDMEVFEEFLALINDQVFSLLDSFQETISAMGYTLVLPQSGDTYPMNGLYIVEDNIVMFLTMV